MGGAVLEPRQQNQSFLIRAPLSLVSPGSRPSQHSLPGQTSTPITHTHLASPGHLMLSCTSSGCQSKHSWECTTCPGSSGRLCAISIRHGACSSSECSQGSWGGRGGFCPPMHRSRGSGLLMWAGVRDLWPPYGLRLGTPASNMD